MAPEATKTKADDMHAHAREAAADVEKLSIVPKDSALSKVIHDGAREPATVSLALQDLAMLVGDIEGELQDENTELVRNGILLIAQGVQKWSSIDDDDVAVLADLNGPAERYE